jgi:hypothetical protein
MVGVDDAPLLLLLLPLRLSSGICCIPGSYIYGTLGSYWSDIFSVISLLLCTNDGE